MASYPTQQYLWTSNTEWIEDAALYEYCTNAVTHYLARHDNAIPNNGIADASGEDDWENTCTYNQTSEDHFREAADGIGMQYQGFRSYAEILKSLVMSMITTHEWLKRMIYYMCSEQISGRETHITEVRGA